MIAGPGSLYTSVLADLIVPGVRQALQETAARKVYVCNIMTQAGESDHYTAADHLQAIYDHLGSGIFDTVLVNDNLDIPPSLLQRYAEEGAYPVQPDLKRLRKMGVQVVTADVLSQGEVVRHDPEKLAKVILTQILDW